MKRAAGFYDDRRRAPGTRRSDTPVKRSAPISSASRAKGDNTSRFGLTWLLGCLLLGVGLFWLAAPDSNQPSASAPALQSTLHAAGQSHGSPLPTAAQLPTQPIETIRLGQRVAGRNPLGSDYQERVFNEPDVSSWRKLSLYMEKLDGDQIEFELLRPLWWIELVGATPGNDIPLDLAELGGAGIAHVRAVEPCPPIQPGQGSVVTGRFRHRSAEVVDLVTSDRQEPIGTTANHPFWSEDRQTFVEAGALLLGEHLRTVDGRLLQLTALTRRGPPEPVYNLEVHGEHVYHVGHHGLLVHNSCALPRHHPIPKFMGGNVKQTNVTILKRPIHVEFHQHLSTSLSQRGLPPMGTVRGSIPAWKEHMFTYPGSQRRAFDAVLDASRLIDKKYGTSLTQDFWTNIMAGDFTLFP